MEKNATTQIAVISALAFGLILGSIGSLRLVSAQENTTAGGSNNLTGVSTGPGAAIPGNVTNPTNATSSPSAVGGGNMTSPTTANVANQTAVSQSSNMTGKPTGPGAAIPGNVTNPTNATSSPSAVGGGNMTSPTTANVANQTAASMQIGGQ
jgi:hypothetical protein